MEPHNGRKVPIKHRKLTGKADNRKHMCSFQTFDFLPARTADYLIPFFKNSSSGSVHPVQSFIYHLPSIILGPQPLVRLASSSKVPPVRLWR